MEEEKEKIQRNGDIHIKFTKKEQGKKCRVIKQSLLEVYTSQRLSRPDNVKLIKTI
jgi:hypothetical protein